MSDSQIMALRGPIEPAEKGKQRSKWDRVIPWLAAIGAALLLSVVWPSDRCVRTEMRGTTCAR